MEPFHLQMHWKGQFFIYAWLTFSRHKCHTFVSSVINIWAFLEVSESHVSYESLPHSAPLVQKRVNYAKQIFRFNLEMWLIRQFMIIWTVKQRTEAGIKRASIWFHEFVRLLISGALIHRNSAESFIILQTRRFLSLSPIIKRNQKCGNRRHLFLGVYHGSLHLPCHAFKIALTGFIANSYSFLQPLCAN